MTQLRELSYRPYFTVYLSITQEFLLFYAHEDQIHFIGNLVGILDLLDICFII